MFRKIIILFYVVFFLLPMASAEDMKNDEFTLQISGQRDGEGYDVNFYITSEKVVVFFHKPTEEKKYFDCNYIYNFTKKDLIKTEKLINKIRNLENFKVSYIMKSYNITKLYLKSSTNSITAYAGEDDFDTTSIQELVGFIIMKSNGKLNFLRFQGQL